MRRSFVVISGLPGSGKSTLARRLAPMLDLAVIDKDDILERLFESKGIGDARWRRTLSRESDVILQSEATNALGAILVSFWRLAGMPVESGTPTDWLASPARHVVHVHCVCDPDVAAGRFCQRRRHPGHLDSESSFAGVLANFRNLVQLPLEAIRSRGRVDYAANAA